MKITPHSLRSINFVICSAMSGAFAFARERNVRNIKKKLDPKTDDKVKPVPIQLKLLVDEVAKELKLGEKFNIRPYISEGTDLESTSGCISIGEVFLGLPQYFVFDNSENTQFSVVVNGKDIPKTAAEYQSLKDCMCLSMEAKKFGIAQQLHVADSDRFSLTVFLPVIVGILGFFLSALLEISLAKAKKPNPVVLHGALILYLCWFYSVIHDVFTVYEEGKADFSVTKLGESYIKGGIEYYEKMIKRNTFLKKINKSAPYTEDGDINTNLFRRQHMPLPTRVTYLTDISKGREVDLWENILSKF